MLSTHIASGPVLMTEPIRESRASVNASSRPAAPCPLFGLAWPFLLAAVPDPSMRTWPVEELVLWPALAGLDMSLLAPSPGDGRTKAVSPPTLLLMPEGWRDEWPGKSSRGGL